MAGPGSELDWHFNYWTAEMTKHACQQLARADTILLGRVTYEVMANYWPSVASDTSYPREDVVLADMMNNHKKIVFSKTLTRADLVGWYNARLVKGTLKREIQKLKQQAGKDMIIYGSGSMASSLIRSGLVDEFALWVHPVVLGKGIPLFRNIENGFGLKLLSSEIFSSGVILIYYCKER